MKLYYLPGACSLADHITLEWLGLDYTALEVPRDELKSDWYRTISPGGSVPALVEDDGWTLTENVAILHYLAEKAPDQALSGHDARSRAEVNRWLGFLNSDVHQSFKPIFGPAGFIDDEALHPALAEHARTRLGKLFTRIDHQLTEREWIAGAQRSIADPYLFVVTRWARAKKVPLDGLDALDAHFERMQQDAGVRAAMAAEGLG